MFNEKTHENNEVPSEQSMSWHAFFWMAWYVDFTTSDCSGIQMRRGDIYWTCMGREDMPVECMEMV